MSVGKNIVMMYFALIVVIVSTVIHFSHRYVGWLDPFIVFTQSRGASTPNEGIIISILFFIPIITLIMAYLYFRRIKDHEWKCYSES